MQAPGPTWLFDVDGCLIDSLTGTSLRPQTIELLEQLRAQGCDVLLWSAGGADYARARAGAAGFAHLVDAFHGKDGRDANGRYRTSHFLDTIVTVVFIDDRPEDMPLDADVIAVFPYLAHNPHDRGLARALDRAFGRDVSEPTAPARRGDGGPGGGPARDHRR